MYSATEVVVRYSKAYCAGLDIGMVEALSRITACDIVRYVRGLFNQSSGQSAPDYVPGQR